MNRRNFIKLSGMGLASTALASCAFSKPSTKEVFEFAPNFLDAPVFVKFKKNHIDEVCIPKETRHSIWDAFRKEADIMYFKCPDTWYETTSLNRNTYITRTPLNNGSKAVSVNITKDLIGAPFGYHRWLTSEEFCQKMNEIIQERYPNKNDWQINTGFKKISIPLNHTTVRFTGSLRRTHFDNQKIS